MFPLFSSAVFSSIVQKWSKLFSEVKTFYECHSHGNFWGKEVLLIKGNRFCVESDTKFSSPCFSIYVCLFYIHPGFSQAIACAHKEFKRDLAYLCSQAEFCLYSYLSLPNHFTKLHNIHILCASALVLSFGPIDKQFLPQM